MASAVQKLRNEVAQGRKTGCTCPICGHYAKEYERHITTAMVKTLWIVKQWFEKNDPGLDKKWLQVENYVAELPLKIRPLHRGASSNFSLLKHWGFIVQRPGVRADGSNRIGYWRITQKGIEFLNDKMKVPKFAVIYNNKLIRFSDDPVSVRDCMTKKFSYAELMAIKS